MIMAKILIADDQDMMRDSLAATLVRQGHEVVAAIDGPTAVTRLSQSRFDLMITDYRMPKMNGNELLAEAKKLRPEMPVVLMSAFATVPNAVEAMKLGAFDYLLKPLDIARVREVVGQALEVRRLMHVPVRVQGQGTDEAPAIAGRAFDRRFD
jgi:two-component system response regulator AtoC